MNTFKMKDNEIIQFAIENLERTTPLRADNHFHDNPTNLPLQYLNLLFGDRKMKFNVWIKQELRNYELPKLFDQAVIQHPLMIVAQRIFPRIKEELRKQNVAYLEMNGNIFFNEQGNYVWIDGNKPFTPDREKANRAFTKTGLKVLFYFLLNEHFVNQPYREIAQRTDVGLGNINNVMNGLKELGYLLNLNKQEYKLTNRKELLEKWMVAYNEILKPTLLIGKFRFLNEQDFQNWKGIRLENKNTVWGGEPAGDFFTHHLRPGELTLYTTETRNELIKHYRLIPDENGNVKVYRKFWNYDEVNYDVVPPILAYVDLVYKDDKRCIETAHMIYDKFIRHNF